LQQILLFTLDEPRFALELAVVERVVQAVEIIPLPKAPPLVAGVINVQGQIIPAVDIRPCFGLPPREANLNDQFILARTSHRRVALVADAVSGIRHLADRELVAADRLMPGTGFIRGVAKVDGTLVLICDLDQILPFDFEQLLDASPAQGPA
jgi:purine-binding chemotaxis protein CheW